MKQIALDGVIHEFPDDFSDREIQAALAQVPPQQSSASPGFLAQIGDSLAKAIGTTTTEFTSGMSDVFDPYGPDKPGNLIPPSKGGPILPPQVTGLMRAAFSPITGFVYNPIKESGIAGEIMVPFLPPFLRGGKTEEAVRQVANEIAALGGAMVVPDPISAVRGMGSKAISKLARKEGTRGLIASEQAEREVVVQEIASKLDTTQGAAQNVAWQANTALQKLESSQADVLRAKELLRQQRRSPIPSPPPIVEPQTAIATAKLEHFPLRVAPTESSLVEAGQRFIGTQATSEIAGTPGLFRTAAKGVKSALSERLTKIMPPGLMTTTVDPIMEAAQKLMPGRTVSGLQTRPQNIASEIDDIISSKMGQLDKGEAIALATNKALLDIPFDQRRTASINDLLDTTKAAVTGRVFIEKGLGAPEGAGLPALANIHGDRVLLRSMKRAAEKAGASLIRNQLQVLEDGYTKAINQSLGEEGAKQLAGWDKDYGYAVRNLFGFDSLPYKLSGKKAEDFAASLFKTSGEGQIERVQKTMELLGPQQKSQMGETFLQVVSKKSQTPEMPFDPIAWGKEYLSYKNGVKRQVLSPQHKADLDEIARTFVQTPLREQQAAIAREAQIAARIERIKQSSQAVQDITTLAQRAKSQSANLEQQLSELQSYGGELGQEISQLGKPSIVEKQALEHLKGLEKPGAFRKFLSSTGTYGQHRLMWGMGALGVGYGSGHTIEAGVMILGAEGLSALLANDRGARLVRLLSKERPGTENAMRLGAAATQLLRQLHGGTTPADQQTP